ncbi:MAG: transposase [Kutzneria sp.]|nr:transposase [Kutzneria sp.]MBV9844207.1 transposase [Kutzneria sp.]
MGADAQDAALTELCSTLFASLPRSDQRGKSINYLRGLLGTPGRKSIRNIAALLGGQATEQSLHHFISSSTWDWIPVRQELARHVVATVPPQAWVVRPMVIPKAGQHSVGVDRYFFPGVGRALNAQQAVGVWATSDGLSAPVNWRLHLSRTWLEHDLRRSQACIPDDVVPETLADCTARAYLQVMNRWQVPARPVVLDARDTNTFAAIGRLRAAGAPLLMRVSGTLELTVVDPALPGYGPDGIPTHQILIAARDMRRLATETTLVAAVRVRLPRQAGEAGHLSRGGELLLLGEWSMGQYWPAKLWLTDMTAAQPASLVRLGMLMDRVDRDFDEITDKVGIRDFAGRSFTGWHRHVTLASVAHTVVALGRR